LESKNIEKRPDFRRENLIWQSSQTSAIETYSRTEKKKEDPNTQSWRGPAIRRKIEQRRGQQNRGGYSRSNLPRRSLAEKQKRKRMTSSLGKGEGGPLSHPDTCWKGERGRSLAVDIISRVNISRMSRGTKEAGLKPLQKQGQWHPKAKGKRGSRNLRDGQSTGNCQA